MSIILKDEDERELGTTVSSRVTLTDEDGEVVRADEINQVEDMTLEVKHSNSGEVVREEEVMEALDDDNGDRFYLDNWVSSEDDEEGEYYFIHRANVGGDPFKLTRIVEMVDVKDDCN